MLSPTPTKLALLMSVAGLGMSLSQAVHAKSDPPNHSRLVRMGLPDGWTDWYADAPQPADVKSPSVPAVPLDEVLPPADEAILETAGHFFSGPQDAGRSAASVGRAEAAPVLSSEDAAAEALSMVLMATPTAHSIPALHRPVNAAPERRRDAAAAARDDSPSPITRPIEMASDIGLDFLGLDLNLDLAPTPTLDLNLDPALDLNLDLASGVTAASAFPLDLNLDLGPVLDLELDLASPVDFRPDRVDLPALPQRVVFEKPIPASPDIQVPGTSCRADPVAQWTDLEAGIVVASHTSRVMRSLEALLSGDDPLSGRFGAQTQEEVVTSETEKALRLLASTGQRSVAPRDWSARPPLDEPATAPRRVERSPIGSGLHALSERNLDQVRGGFTTSSGLKVSFGIERAVSINGNLVAKTSFNVSDQGKVTASAGSDSLALIQNGAGNIALVGPVSAATLGTVVQNTLNDQKIQSVTTINAAVNSLQIVRLQNLESSLRGAIVDSLRR